MPILSQIKTGLTAPDRVKRLLDFVWAGVLFRLPRSLRATLYTGSEKLCPICNTPLRSFVNLHRPYHRFCPVCQSLQRHRFVWLLLREFLNVSCPRSLLRVLHIAPEPALSDRLRESTRVVYISGDAATGRAMLRLSLTALQFREGVFDLLLCSHVLEHIVDDQRAIREMARVLKPEGLAVILVPITAAVTIEDNTIVDSVKRERIFGQRDHVRRYGPDVSERLVRNGFSARRLVPTEHYTPAEIECYGLNPRDVIFFCRKANEPKGVAG